MIDAYLDESGIHDGAAICVVAGYFGGRNQFRKLEAAWKKVLSDFRFPLSEFHAKHLLGSHKHRPMLEALAQSIAAQPRVHPVSFAIIVDDFKSFSLDERRWLTGASPGKNGKFITSGCPNKPYFVPFLICLRTVTDYADVGGKAHFFFGLDRPFAEYAVTVFKQVKDQIAKGAYPSQWESKTRLGNADFPQASETPQLQAADFLVHLTYQRMLERHADNDNFHVPPSDMLADCLRNRRSNEDHVFQDRSSLQTMFEKARAFSARALIASNSDPGSGV